MTAKFVSANTRTLREINKSLVLSAINSKDSISRIEIARATNLSVATVTNLVSELLKEKTIIETGYKESTGGRRSGLIEINSNNLFIIGVELGESEIIILLVNFKLEKISFKKIPLDEGENKPDKIITIIINLIKSEINNNNISIEKVIGIGIGVPGLVDSENGVSIFAPNWGWHNVNLKNAIEKKLRIQTFVENGANVMALGERWIGAAKGINNVISLIIGTGLGAGIIVNGEVCRGISESAGEWGHMTINVNGQKCGCGSMGCLEAYAGVRAILRRTEEIISSTKKDTILKKIDKKKPSNVVKKIIEAALKEDPIAIQILEETGKYLGIGIANLINLFNPEVVILGGWVEMEAGKILLPIIRSTAEKYALKFPFSSVKIVISELADQAIVIGASTLVLNNFIRPPRIKSLVNV